MIDLWLEEFYDFVMDLGFKNLWCVIELDFVKLYDSVVVL